MSPNINQLNAILNSALGAASNNSGGYTVPSGRAGGVPLPSTYSRPAGRPGRNQTATETFRSIFNGSVAAGGHPGTGASAGSHTRLTTTGGKQLGPSQG
jgi:hypothetical protein